MKSLKEILQETGYLRVLSIHKNINSENVLYRSTLFFQDNLYYLQDLGLKLNIPESDLDKYFLDNEANKTFLLSQCIKIKTNYGNWNFKNYWGIKKGRQLLFSGRKAKKEIYGNEYFAQHDPLQPDQCIRL